MRVRTSMILCWSCCLLGIPFCRSLMVKIIDSRKVVEGFKVGEEAELAFFTEKIGFVNDGYLQKSTAWEDALEEYSKEKKTGQRIFTIKLTQQFFDKHKLHLCITYLNDPIFVNSGISLDTIDPDKDILCELKDLQFQYISKPWEPIKVIRCPVKVENKGPTRLYFQEIYLTWPKQQGLFRGYFAFKNVETVRKWTQPLEIIMFARHTLPMPDIDEIGEEVVVKDSTEKWLKTFWFDLTLKNEEKHGYRSMGKRAEMQFLMKMYGFIDFGMNLEIRENMAMVMDEMKTGYEIDLEMLMSQKQEIKNAKDFCDTNLMRSIPLMQQNIVPNKSAPQSHAKWTKKSVRFIQAESLTENRDYELLQCPVTEGLDHQPGFIYILPIYFKNYQKTPHIFIFSDIESASEEVYPFLLSPIHETIYKHSNLRRVQDEEKQKEEIIEMAYEAKSDVQEKEEKKEEEEKEETAKRDIGEKKQEKEEAAKKNIDEKEEQKEEATKKDVDQTEKEKEETAKRSISEKKEEQKEEATKKDFDETEKEKEETAKRSISEKEEEQKEEATKKDFDKIEKEKEETAKRSISEKEEEQKEEATKKDFDKIEKEKEETAKRSISEKEEQKEEAMKKDVDKIEKEKEETAKKNIDEKEEGKYKGGSSDIAGNLRGNENNENETWFDALDKSSKSQEDEPVEQEKNETGSSLQ